MSDEPRQFELDWSAYLAAKPGGASSAKGLRVITAAECGPGLLRLMASRRERWFWRHRTCSVREHPRPREHYTSWFCWTHGKTWTDYFGPY